MVWRNGLDTLYSAEDYNLWKANFGATAGAAAVSGSIDPRADFDFLDRGRADRHQPAQSRALPQSRGIRRAILVKPRLGIFAAAALLTIGIAAAVFGEGKDLPADLRAVLAVEFRTIDGTGNNTFSPSQGARGHPRDSLRLRRRLSGWHRRRDHRSRQTQSTTRQQRRDGRPRASSTIEGFRIGLFTGASF